MTTWPIGHPGPPPVLALDEAALDAATLDAATLDAAVLDEAAVDEAAVEEAAVDEATLDEAALDDATLDEAPLDDVTLDAAAFDEAALTLVDAPDSVELEAVTPPNPPVPAGEGDPFPPVEAADDPPPYPAPSALSVSLEPVAHAAADVMATARIAGIAQSIRRVFIARCSRRSARPPCERFFTVRCRNEIGERAKRLVATNSRALTARRERGGSVAEHRALGSCLTEMSLGTIPIVDAAAKARAEARRATWTGGVARSFDELEEAGLAFWRDAAPETKLQAMWDLIVDAWNVRHGSPPRFLRICLGSWSLRTLNTSSSALGRWAFTQSRAS